MDRFFDLMDEPFLVGETNLQPFLNRPRRLEGGLIFLCFQGEAVISTGVIEYQLITNTKLTLLPGTILTLHQASSNFKGEFIAFSEAIFREVNFRLEGPFLRFLKDNPIYTFPDEKVELIHGALKFIFTIYHDRENQFRYEIIKSQLQCMFWNTYDKTHRHFLIQKKKSNVRNEELFHNFISLIHEHCKKEREVSFYADKLCISPRYLSSIVRQVTSESAKEIIDHHIILEIKVLLQSTNLPIQEIAHQLHFPDQSYLGRYFKRYTGESPSEYRNRL